jgi:DNA-binding transcriptional ArsR family regulator
VNDVSPRALAVLAQAGGPVRLRILLALEEREQSTAELAAALDISFDSADNGVRKMVRAGLVRVVRAEQASEHAHTMRRVYGNQHSGWAGVRDALEEVASSP